MQSFEALSRPGSLELVVFPSSAAEYVEEDNNIESERILMNLGPINLEFYA